MQLRIKGSIPCPVCDKTHMNPHICLDDGEIVVLCPVKEGFFHLNWQPKKYKLSDDLKPAKGVLVGCLIDIVFWLAIGLAVWLYVGGVLRV